MTDRNEPWLVRNILGPDGEALPEDDCFEVSWDAVPIRIRMGKEAILPFYQAEHFARHLANHILTTRKGRPNDTEERSRTVSAILLRPAHESDLSRE